MHREHHQRYGFLRRECIDGYREVGFPFGSKLDDARDTD